MEIDKEILEEKIRHYRKTKSCAEATLRGLCECGNIDITPEEITHLSCGFAGGIGGTFDEGTCGALTGALMANGLMGDDAGQIKSNAKKLFETFKDEYGSVRCDVISRNGEDKSPCVDCCVFIANKEADLLEY